MKSGTFQTLTSGPARITTIDEAEKLAETLKLDLEDVPVKAKAHDPVNPKPVIKEEVIDAQRMESKVNDVKDTVNTFMDKITQAKCSGEYYVETSPEVFEHYMRGQKTAYFIYDGIRVYKYGTKEGIERDERKVIT